MGSTSYDSVGRVTVLPVGTMAHKRLGTTEVPVCEYWPGPVRDSKQQGRTALDPSHIADTSDESTSTY